MEGGREKFPGVRIEEISAELFGLLNSREGEDLQAVKGCERRPGLGGMVEARTPEGTRSMGTAVRIVGRIASPPRITNLTQVETHIRTCEDHQCTLAKEFRESFSDTVRVGIMLQMLPKQTRDFVLQARGEV